jgi:hypothetical protein
MGFSQDNGKQRCGICQRHHQTLCALSILFTWASHGETMVGDGLAIPNGAVPGCSLLRSVHNRCVYTVSTGMFDEVILGLTRI